MDRTAWRATQFLDSAGVLAERPTSIEVGVADLLTLHELTEELGVVVDRDIEGGAAEVMRSYAALMARLDPTCRMGPRSRVRVDSVHDVQRAGAIAACEPMVFGDLQPPAGITISAWTHATTLPKSTPGVVVLEDGTKVRTYLLCAAAGGEGPLAWNCPVLIDPAHDARDATALALQGLNLARRGRELVRRFAPEVNGVRIGSLPILAGSIRPAEAQPTGGFLGAPVAFGDIPDVVDELEDLTCAEVPFLVQACLSPEGSLAPPDRAFLHLARHAGPDAERPESPYGLAGKLYGSRIVDVLVGTRQPLTEQALDPIMDVAAVARVTRGRLAMPGTRGLANFRGVGVVTYEGRRSVGITNIGSGERAMIRLGMAVEGLFGSTAARAACRRRTSRFVARFDIPTLSVPAARRLFGVVAMAYAGTVVERVRP